MASWARSPELKIHLEIISVLKIRIGTNQPLIWPVQSTTDPWLTEFILHSEGSAMLWIGLN